MTFRVKACFCVKFTIVLLILCYQSYKVYAILNIKQKDIPKYSFMTCSDYGSCTDKFDSS